MTRMYYCCYLPNQTKPNHTKNIFIFKNSIIIGQTKQYILAHEIQCIHMICMCIPEEMFACLASRLVGVGQTV